jgi:hypothetical protein
MRVFSLFLALSLSACESSGGQLPAAFDGGLAQDGGAGHDGGTATDGGGPLADGGPAADGGAPADAGPPTTTAQCVRLADRIEDAHVTTLPAFANSSYGGAEILTVGYWPGGSDGGPLDEIRTFIKFPMHDLPPNPAQVSLRLWALQHGGSCTQARITAHRVTDNWTDTRITWNNQPGHDPSVSAAGTVVPGDPGFVALDITSLYRSLHQAGANNFGFVLKGECAEVWNTNFASSNLTCSGTDTAPYKPALLYNTSACPDDPESLPAIRDIDCTAGP